MRRAFWDSHYTCPASAVTQAMRVNGNEPVYLYAWDVSDSKDGGRSLGALQDIEAAALWGPEHGRLPDDYKQGRRNQKVPLIKQRYWANFIRSLNPNKPRVMSDLDNVKMAHGDEVQPQGWLTWYAGGHKEFYFRNGGKTMTHDSRHLKQICDFWNALAPKMNM
ncbi:hypothetical protein NLG97_g3474 [Lecanicillium saksenae]|uniref:Uncharacterized protein n=1 Tax=Lecanicillium saksenae TaxID=468837 RepID=A0ACC1QY73_9HYPO|nr:hypothetical protein NLG97_g3474 [Lecanicillium saksenae]